MEDTSLDQYGYKQELKRTMGIGGIIAYGLIFINPMAALIIYGFVAQYSNGMDSLVYIIGVVGILFTALSYIRMVKEFPISGSVFSYIQRAINPHVGFVAGWLILIDYALIPAFILALAGIYLSILIPAIPMWLGIVGFVLINTIVNILGIEWGKKANFSLLAFEIGAVLAFIITGIVFVARGGGTAGLSLDPIIQPDVFGLGFIATATSIAVVAFLGFDAMTTLVEETKDSVRVISKGIIAVLVLIGGIFFVETYVGNLIHPGFEGLDPDAGLFEIATIAANGASWLMNWLLIAFILSLGFGTALNAQMAASRIVYSMGRDRTLPGFLGTVHPKYQTPYVATLAFGAITLVLALSVDVETLIGLVNFGAMTAFLMLNIGVIWHFFIKKNLRTGADLWKYLVAPVIGTVVIGYVWYGFATQTKVLGLIWIVLGIAYGAAQSRGYKVAPVALKDI